MSDEDFRKTAEELAAFAGSLGRLDRSAIVTSLKAIGIGAVGGLVVVVLVGTGQPLAVGFHAAFQLYRIWWLASPFLGAAAPVVLFLGGLLFFSGTTKIGQLGGATFSKRATQVLGRLGLAGMIVLKVGMMIGTPVFMGYDAARRANELLAGSALKDLEEVRRAVGDQSVAFAQLSTSAMELLEKLNDAEQGFRATRNELAATLQTVLTNLAQASAASDQVEGLMQRQRQIELRMAELQRLLDGGTPITRENLQRSSRNGLFLGAAFGFAASVGAAIFYNWFARRWRRRRVTEGAV